MKYILIVLLVIAFSESYAQADIEGFFVSKSIKLENSVNGVDGYLRVLLDNRLKMEDVLGNCCFSDYYSILQVVDKTGVTTSTYKIQYPIVGIEKIFLYNNNKPTYLVTLNNFLGAGRESGHLTYFVEVENANIKFVVTNEGLQSSLSSDWRVASYRNDENKEIFFLQSTFNEELKNILILRRFYFENGAWSFKEKSILSDWWEKGENEFPKLSDFP